MPIRLLAMMKAETEMDQYCIILVVRNNRQEQTQRVKSQQKNNRCVHGTGLCPRLGDSPLSSHCIACQCDSAKPYHYSHQFHLHGPSKGAQKCQTWSQTIRRAWHPEAGALLWKLSGFSRSSCRKSLRQRLVNTYVGSRILSVTK